MATEYQIGALWIGGTLSYLEQLCLVSFIDAGHHVRLYTYDGVENVPDGVEIADADDILPQTGFLRHGRTGSPALHSDVFRYHLLAKEDRTIWADTDAYCVKPFTTPTGHFHAWESEHVVNGGVLGLPRNSETLRQLLDFTADEFSIPPWYRGRYIRRLQQSLDAGTPIPASAMPWGVWGPHAITHFLKVTGEVRFSLPSVALYPFSFRDRNMMVRHATNEADFITDETFSIHFYGRRMRRRLLACENGIPSSRSLIGRLLKKHNIDPALAPIPGKPEPEDTDDDLTDDMTGDLAGGRDGGRDHDLISDMSDPSIRH